MKLTDDKSREAIEKNLEKNYFVEAGAGSGKTYCLVSRMVSRVKSGTDISKLAAITFTKAAAVEFLERFEKRLSEEISNDSNSKEEKDNCKNALLNINQCFLGTIDSFCNMVLLEHPIEAGIPIDSVVAEDNEYDFLLSEEYNNIINNINSYDQELQDLYHAFLRFNKYPKNNFIAIIKSILDKRNNHLTTKSYKEIKDNEDKFYNTYKKDVISLIEIIEKDDFKYVIKKQKNDKIIKGQYENINYIKGHKGIIYHDWEQRPYYIVDFIPKALKGLNLVSAVEPSDYSLLHKYFGIDDKNSNKMSIDKDNPLFKELSNIQFDYSISFVYKCIDIVTSNLIKKGKLTFYDNLLLFRNLLRKDAKEGGNLIKHIANRHTYYYIDEFQDTDPLQAEIFFYLSTSNPKENYEECVLDKGRLFIVGDPKQSIYRFRSADIVSYEHIKELFRKQDEDSILYLTKNRRSFKALIDGFNPMFNKMFEEESPYQAKFDSDIIFHKENKNKEFEGFYKYNATKDEEPDTVADIVNDLIFTQNINYKDIMVLTTSKKKLKAYMNSFDLKDIPYRIEGLSLFDSSEALVKLIYIFGIFAYPNEKQMIYKVLNKVLLLNDKSIYEILKSDHYSLNDDPNNNKCKHLYSFYKDNLNEDIIILFDKIVEEFKLNEYSDPYNIEYLYYAKELLRNELSKGSIITLRDAYNYLHDLSENKSIERCISLTRGKNDNRVTLANVHKVKGLEAKVVFLTNNSDKAKPFKDNDVGSHSENGEITYFNISGETKFYSIIQTTENKEILEKEKEAIIAEDKRIAYVGATRAINALFINEDIFNKKGDLKEIWGHLIKDEDNASIFETYNLHNINNKRKDSIDASTLIKKKDFNIKLSSPSYKIVSPSTIHTEFYDHNNDVKKTDATLKGSIVHKLMELVVSSKNKVSIDNIINIINDKYGLNKTYDDLLKKVYETITKGGYNQTTDLPNDILNEIINANEVYTETPFSYKDGNDIYNGIIDLIYRKQDKWFIVDYKTNYDDKDLDKRYEEQLECYKKALYNRNINAESYIYHIDF